MLRYLYCSSALEVVCRLESVSGGLHMRKLAKLKESREQGVRKRYGYLVLCGLADLACDSLIGCRRGVRWQYQMAIYLRSRVVLADHLGARGTAQAGKASKDRVAHCQTRSARASIRFRHTVLRQGGQPQPELSS